MNKSEKAVHYFNQGFNCAQAVVAVFADNFDLDEKQALKLASAFGGGICRKGETCGAVTGALMAIGLKFGMSESNGKEAKEKTYVEANKFINEFKKIHSTLVCRELLGYDLSKPIEVKEYKEKNPGPDLCPYYVKDAATIVERLIS